VATISIRAVRDTVKRGEPVLLKATLTNQSNHEISVWCDKRSNFNYVVEVSERSGKPLPDQRLGYRNGRLDFSPLSPEQLIKTGLIYGSGACVPVKPGASLLDGETIEVSKLYDMTKPGVYTIVVERPDPESTSGDRSRRLTVTVTE
jgi:hypothetical protein